MFLPRSANQRASLALVRPCRRNLELLLRAGREGEDQQDAGHKKDRVPHVFQQVVAAKALLSVAFFCHCCLHSTLQQSATWVHMCRGTGEKLYCTRVAADCDLGTHVRR